MCGTISNSRGEQWKRTMEKINNKKWVDNGSESENNKSMGGQ